MPRQEATGSAARKWMMAAAGTWLTQAATGRSRRSTKRSDEEPALFLGRGRGSRPRRLAAAGDGAGRQRQVPRARPAAGSLLQMTSLHGGGESDGWVAVAPRPARAGAAGRIRGGRGGPEAGGWRRDGAQSASAESSAAAAGEMANEPREEGKGKKWDPRLVAQIEGH